MSEASASTRPNLPEFTVGDLSAALRRTVEDSFPFVRVKGEVSNLKVHSSGHIYFDLKDERATLNAVIWRMTARQLRVKPERGVEVVCTGRVTTYAASSRYQLIVEQVELAGLGALMALLEARKKKLAQEGLFDAGRKRKLPFLPEIIGVITSPTGAVIRDIMHRLNARFPRRVLLWPVAVQGERAAADLVAAIRGFNGLPARGAVRRPDLLIVARGGGSLEDLMPFNEEVVVRAVAESGIPVISAVGHETDTTLIDLAADVRAPTPTAAAEMAVPVRTELLAQSLDLERRALRSFAKGVEQRRRTLSQIGRILPRADQLFSAPRQRLDQVGERLMRGLSTNLRAHDNRFAEAKAKLSQTAIRRHVSLCVERTKRFTEQLNRAQGTRLTALRRDLEATSRVLEGVSYNAVLDRGFALVRGEDGAVKRRAAAIATGERLSIKFADGVTDAFARTGVRTAKTTSPKKSGGGQGDLF
jgi:exodeoxyribonuclease VII large subunit